MSWQQLGCRWHCRRSPNRVFLGSFNTNFYVSKEHVLVNLHLRCEAINFQLKKVSYLDDCFQPMHLSHSYAKIGHLRKFHESRLPVRLFIPWQLLWVYARLIKCGVVLLKIITQTSLYGIVFQNLYNLLPWSAEKTDF